MNLVQASQIVAQMEERGLINEREARIIKSAIGVKALNNPINIDNILRANILKQITIELIRK